MANIQTAIQTVMGRRYLGSSLQHSQWIKTKVLQVGLWLFIHTKQCHGSLLASVC